MEGQDRFDVWQANVDNLRSQLLFCRAMLGESLERFDPDGRLEVRRTIQSLGLASFQSLQTLEKITKELAYLDETSFHVAEMLERLHPHARTVRDHFLDSSPEQKDQV